MSDVIEMLEIIDEDDTVIGLETRSKTHVEGLLHREIHIWFLTPKGEIIFQHRAKDKVSHPDKLDATVGGHVEPTMSYEDTAIKECKEETGIDVDPSKLVFLGKIRRKFVDKKTGLINNALRSQYAYLYNGDIRNLRIEEGKSEGFETWKIDDLLHVSEVDRDRFIPGVLYEDTITLFKQARELLLQ